MMVFKMKKGGILGKRRLCLKSIPPQQFFLQESLDYRQQF